MLKINNFFLLLFSGWMLLLWEHSPICLSLLNIHRIQIVHPSDCGAFDGQIIFFHTCIDTAGFQFSIDGGINWQKAPIFRKLGPGTYLPVIRSVKGTHTLEFNESAILKSLVAPVIQDISLIHPSNLNVSNGILQITASAGTGSYEYSINGGQSWQGLGLFTGLSAGNYEILVRNSDETCVVEYGVVKLKGL